MVEIEATPERVFAALTTPEVAQWWGSPETYRIDQWTMDLRQGGEWRSEGTAADGHRFSVGGTVLEVSPPRLLVHSWRYNWAGGGTTTVRYEIEPRGTSGSRLTVTQWGFGADTAGCEGHAQGWERVLTWLTSHVER
jgi:uncharacterized protein YndB with AHSA1/START domain